jgi:hypothetical protein
MRFRKLSPARCALTAAVLPLRATAAPAGTGFPVGDDDDSIDATSPLDDGRTSSSGSSSSGSGPARRGSSAGFFFGRDGGRFGSSGGRSGFGARDGAASEVPGPAGLTGPLRRFESGGYDGGATGDSRTVG